MIDKDNWMSPRGPLTPSCSQRLLDSCSKVLNELFRPYTPIQTHQLVAGAGCSLLLEAVARVVCDENEVILTPGPVWPVFTVILAQAKVFLSVVPSGIDAGESVSAEQAVKEMDSFLYWTDETEQIWEHHFNQLVKDGKVPRAVLLSNPHNPLGRCYPRSFLIHVLEFCEKVSSCYQSEQ